MGTKLLVLEPMGNQDVEVAHMLGASREDVIRYLLVSDTYENGSLTDKDIEKQMLLDNNLVKTMDGLSEDEIDDAIESMNDKIYNLYDIDDKEPEYINAYVVSAVNVLKAMGVDAVELRMKDVSMISALV